MAKIDPSSTPPPKKRRRQSVLPNILSLNRAAPSLDNGKFEELMAIDFASGFEESETCFSEITTKAAAIMQAETCYIFTLDDKEHKLCTFLNDEDDKEIKITKPLDRGITGSVLSDPKCVNLQDVSTSRRWSAELDEHSNIRTYSYLACPLWDIAAGAVIGVVELRNKISGDGSFDTADAQLVRIVAFQLSRAIVHYRQQTLLAGHNEAINMAYEKNFDSSESISIDTEHYERNIGSPLPKLGLKKAFNIQRSAFALTPSWNWKPFGHNTELAERGWDYDVFLQSEEALTMHAVDVFDERGLFSRFSIPMTTFLNFVNEIKAGYSKDAPYHNCFHAFDVMHVCYLLITKCRADEFLESFNVLSILVGALGHDLGHDGFNNSFHSVTNSELAIMYNGVSILENYSAAYLFRILRKEKCNIFARLSVDDATKMRSRLIDLILDTDAKNHFMLMTRFKHGLEMKQLSRGLLSSMLLHVSDVSNPTRPGAIARKWAYAVQEEFFRQGDKEKELNLPRSPFMDREFENLPRMQGAFIDALVTPVFKLLAEFLPSVNEQCIKTLYINRAFWNNMLNQGIFTTEAIISYLERGHTEEESNSERVAIEEHPVGVPDSDPIPGIPANAPKEFNQSTRKLSFISIKEKEMNMIDPELGRLHIPSEISLRNSALRETQIRIIRKTKTGMMQFLDSGSFQIAMLLSTMYALFANDLNLALGDKDADKIVDIFTLVVLLAFIMEMIMSIICIEKYTHFFFWLDLIASISLLLEIDFLMEFSEVSGSPEELTLAKASRAAKAGARAGRLAKLFRLIRLIKIAKLMNWIISFVRKRRERVDEILDLGEDIDLKMSVVGRKMTESITKKVIIAVMIMLAVFSLTEVSFVPDARQVQLDAIANNPESDILLKGYFTAHENLIELRGIGDDFVDLDKIDELREVEIMTIYAKSNSSVVASFDLSEETAITAWYSLGTTVIVTSLLAILGMLFSRDAYNIMIRPIEKMKSTVQRLSENPLLHLEKLKKRGASESNETDMLEQAINKMATLLQVGFGCAGAEIIAKSLSDMGELDPMVPGVRVNAIFGFCDIRDFTFATEHLQQDVMVFVNKVAEMTHRYVVDSGGAPNKNIGDAFLLVWKLNSSKNGERRNLQKDLFDSALLSIQNIITDIKQIGSFSNFMREENDENASWETSLKDFKVGMGFGLHTGWAIEGSIGSKVKVDASYLSPHVNLASRLEAATKQYNVPLLMSDAFVSGLTGSIQSTCRRVDCVVFKGSNEAMNIFHQDIEPFQNLKTMPDNYAYLMSATSWEGEEEVNNLGIDISGTLEALQSDKNLLIREIYDVAFNAYLDGEWGKCKVLFHLWLEKFPGDAVVQVLVQFLMKHNFKTPSDWPGHHVLQAK